MGVHQPLERLKVDHVDLLQMHNVSSMALFDEVTAHDGALRAVIRARDEGLTRGVGITADVDQATRTLEALSDEQYSSVFAGM